MSEQADEHPTSSKRRPSSKDTAKSRTDVTGQQSRTFKRPGPTNREGWRAYWKARGQDWRTEPEITEEQQRLLAEYRAIAQFGHSPFEGVKLARADIEWLLETHTNKGIVGPVDWSDVKQSKRKGLDLGGANLQNVTLSFLPLARTDFNGVQLQEADLRAADLRGANFTDARLEDADLENAQLQGADLSYTSLEKSSLNGAHLQKADLTGANLKQADLSGANLQGAILRSAQLEGTILTRAQLQGANLQKASMDVTTDLFEVKVDKKIRVADVRWNGVMLLQINWDKVPTLDDEYYACQPCDDEGQRKSKNERLRDYQAAVRAYRQLATALRSQGLNEEADRFAYRSHLLQRVVLRRQRKWLKYLASWFFWLIAGYGYRPLHSVIAYLLIILSFMGLYLLNAQIVAPHLTWDQALVLSVSSFHGRGFFEQDITLGSGYARLAAAEAVLGLLIEISFIATFTQRFFGK